MKKVIALIAALFLLASCSGKASTTSSSPSAQVTVGLTYIPNIQFAPFYVGVEKGYFADEGVEVTLRHHGAQEALLGALEAGNEDVVFAGADEMMQGRGAGIDVVNWATMYQKYPVKLIVPADSPIRSVADLSGRSVGLPGPYGANYFVLLAMLKSAGLTESDVDVQYIGYTQAAALSSGKVDSIIGYANSDAQAISASLGASDLSGVRMIDPVEGGLPLVGVGLGSLASNLDAQSATYTKMIAALNKSVEFARENPDETVEIAAKYVSDLADPERRESAKLVLSSTLDFYQGTEVFGSQDAQTWEKMASFMQDNGLLEAPVKADNSFVDLTK
ncbi:ABC transporter substrate-binding protein [Arcanobacterium haemolyticum]|nr:ABC transporter substrate-binding protein [Arcanobacterium haemolyticum]